MLESSEHIYPAASLPKRKRRFRNGSLKIETLKKKKKLHWNIGVNWRHHFILFRYAETLLNYAEAMNELGGPDYTSDADELPMSARTALNMVRSAANMPNITDNGDDFTTRLRNERRIELAFEDHRFWDIRRWMIGDVVKDIYGVKITKKGSKYSYTPVKIQTRVWEEKMNLYPIAQSEIYKNGNLTQNDGWE